MVNPSVVSTLKCRTRVIPAQAGIQKKLLKHWIEVGAYLPPTWEWRLVKRHFICDTTLEVLTHIKTILFIWVKLLLRDNPFSLPDF